MNCCTSGDPAAEIGNNGDSAPWVTWAYFYGTVVHGGTVVNVKAKCVRSWGTPQNPKPVSTGN